MILWNGRAAINESRKKGSAIFKRRGARKCRFCPKIFPNPQKLRWHIWREHK